LHFASYRADNNFYLTPSTAIFYGGNSILAVLLYAAAGVITLSGYFIEFFLCNGLIGKFDSTLPLFVCYPAILPF